jgi:hypothetical protein
MSDLDSILQRNARVEADKAWETSWARKIMICVLTYVFLLIYLPMLGHDKAYLHATVPVFGYLFSTITIPFIKKWWLENRYKKKD